MNNADFESFRCLEKLIDANSQLLYSDRFLTHYGRTDIEGSFFHIKISENSYIKLEFSWFECPETLLDYSVISVRDAEFKVSENTAIFSFYDSSRYKNISLLSFSHTEDETLISESAVLLEREDEKSVLIYSGDSAFRNTVLEHDQSKIRSHLSSAVKVRKVGDKII